MNDNRIHRVFALMSMSIPEIIIDTIRDPDLTVDEILTGSMAALFNVYRSVYNKDAEFTEFLAKAKLLGDQHIKECKEGEKNENKM